MHNIILKNFKILLVVLELGWVLVACANSQSSMQTNSCINLTPVIMPYTSFGVNKTASVAGDTLTYTISLDKLPLSSPANVVLYVSLDQYTTYIDGSAQYFVGEEIYSIPDNWIAHYQGDLTLGQLNVGQVLANTTYSVVYSVQIVEDVPDNYQIEGKAQAFIQQSATTSKNCHLAYIVITNIVLDKDTNFKLSNEIFTNTQNDDFNFSLVLENSGVVDARDVTIQVVPPIPEIGNYGYVLINAQNIEDPIKQVVWWDESLASLDVTQGSIIIRGNTKNIPSCHADNCNFDTGYLFRQPLHLGTIVSGEVGALEILWVD